MTATHPAEPVVAAVLTALDATPDNGWTITPDEAAKTIVGALRAAGHIVETAPAFTKAELHEAATWLVTRADHPRVTYYGPEALLESKAAVEEAHTAALRRSPRFAEQITGTRDLLVRAIADSERAGSSVQT